MAINETRQIMMNELGLTKESIRKEAESIIQSTIEKHINSGRLDDIVRSAVITQFNFLVKNDDPRPYNFENLISTIKRCINEEVKNQIKELISVEVKLRNKE